jgi:hypothetical protein
MFMQIEVPLAHSGHIPLVIHVCGPRSWKRQCVETLVLCQSMWVSPSTWLQDPLSTGNMAGSGTGNHSSQARHQYSEEKGSQEGPGRDRRGKS